MLRAALIFSLMLVAVGAASQTAPASAEGKIWTGIYSTVQAIRGKVNFTGSCERCHGQNLGGGTGPALTGTRFMATWENESVYRLFTKVRDTMPPNFGTALTDEAKLDVVSYILQANGFPAGSSDLKITADELETIRIVKKGQGAAVPNFSFIQAVGCLTPGLDSTWLLSRTSEPAISRDQPSTAEELKTAAGMSPGTLTFRLVSTAAFKPESHRGKRVEVKGLLYRDETDARINVTSLQTIGESCAP
jgi:mono/diheme cytochrome c family protein